jgi:phosphoglycolate phosphatase
VTALVSSSKNQPGASAKAFVRPGFCWKGADAYLFDIDGTLLNSRDPVHYFAFHHAVRDVFGREVRIDGIPVHGNTDIGILRAVLQRDGFTDSEINARLPQMIEQMCAEAERNAGQMRPELCPAVPELLAGLKAERKLLGAASGNLEPIGWLKLERAGLKHMFSFGSFCFPRERRADILVEGMRLARQRLGRQASVFVVGDTPADIEGARLAGASVIAVATGIYEFEDLLTLKPDACFGCGTDMLRIW